MISFSAIIAQKPPERKAGPGPADFFLTGGRFVCIMEMIESKEMRYPTMAKKTQKSAAASKPMSKKERAAAEAAAAREAERKAQNAQKNRQMGMVFLYAVLSLIALFCFYTLLKALFFPAASVSELRDNLLFLSTVSIPYLIGAAAVIVHAVVKRRSRGTSDRAGRSHRILFLLVLAAAVLMFSSQLLGGKTDVSEHPALKNTVAALAQSEAGIGFQPDASSAGFRSMLEGK